MFGLGTGELLIVLALALIFIGPEKIPELATQSGKLVRKLKAAIDDIKTDLKG